jgi:hypothetical protein
LSIFLCIETSSFSLSRSNYCKECICWVSASEFWLLREDGGFDFTFCFFSTDLADATGASSLISYTASAAFGVGSAFDSCVSSDFFSFLAPCFLFSFFSLGCFWTGAYLTGSWTGSRIYVIPAMISF